MILDGEIVALEAGDRPSFARLQQRIHLTRPLQALLAEVPVVYFVFDVLHLEGQDLTGMPYSARRDVLAGLGLQGEHVRVPANFHGVDGPTMLKAAEVAGLEGVVAKRLISPYRPGKRAGDAWVKVPLVRTQEVLVVGWRPGEGRRLGLLGSLLVAVYDEQDQLTYAGKVGTGFTDRMLRHLEQDLKPLARVASPVPDVPREDARHAHWVEPVLAGEVQFRNWTPEGRLRHPSWRGLRTDRNISSVRRVPEPIPYPPQGEVIGAFAFPVKGFCSSSLAHPR